MSTRGIGERAGVAAAVAMVAALGWALVARPGYSPDEEITFFAVRGIHAQATPVMPSGILYWRGALYSYIAAAASSLTGETWRTFRTISLLAGVATVLIVSAISRSLTGSGVIAALLIASWPITVALFGSARFYAAFLAVYSLAVLAFVRAMRRQWPMWPFVVLAVVARAFHEFALAIVVLPVAALVTTRDPEERRRHFAAAAACAAALAIAHAAIVHWLQTPETPGLSWGTNTVALSDVVASLPLGELAHPVDRAIVLALLTALALAVAGRDVTDRAAILLGAACAAVSALGMVVAVGVAWALARPARSVHIARSTLLLVVAGWLAMLVVLVVRANTALSGRLALDLLVSGLRYGWEGPRLMATQLPVLAISAVAGAFLLFRREVQAGDDPQPGRAIALAAWMQVTAVAMSGLDLRARYIALLSPLLAACASAPLSALVVGARRAGRRSFFAIAILVVVLAGAAMTAEQWRMAAAQTERSLASRWWTPWAPPVSQASMEPGDAPYVPLNDIVIANDELASLLRVGRLDYWWAPDDIALGRFSFQTTGGPRRGVYGGAPALVGLDAVLQVIDNRGGRGVSVVLFDSGKFGFDPASLSSLKRLAPVVQESGTNDWALLRLSWPASAP